MTAADADVQEESLDPRDWDEMRALGRRMVDEMMTYLETVRDRPVWQPVSDDIKKRLEEPLPLEPEGAQQAYEEFLGSVLPHPMGNIHPRFWGWVIGTGTPLGALAEMLAAAMNPNAGGGDHIANYVEHQVLTWCKEMLGYPIGASGLLVSGGSMANLVGLTVARNTKAGFEIRQKGLASEGRRLTLYGSVEMHSSLHKGVELLGLGRESLREIPVDEEFRVRVDLLKERIAEDREAGHQPICIIGNAGTVNTGAFDDLSALADLSQDEEVWFHVDGAFGALAALAPDLQPLVAGMERADSLAFDMHKWMYLPYEVGCALVRHPQSHIEAFSLTPEYLTHAERGVAAGPPWLSDYGVQLSRGFRALKVWISFKAHGIRQFGRVIQQNVDQARYLAGLVEDAPDLEILVPVSLNIVCFRFVAPGFDGADLDPLNHEILLRIHESGVAVPSSTTLNGSYALRVCVTNHRSRRSDFDLLIEEIRRQGNQLLREREVATS